MTLGPMPCMTCGYQVWYDHGRMLSRYWGQWRTHSCRLGLGRRRYRAEHPAKWTPEYIAAYKREWDRQRRPWR